MVVLIITAVLTALFGFYPLIKHSNNKKNAALDADPKTATEDRIINDQPKLKKFRYGLYPCAHNACECIAVHNAKLLMGIGSSLSRTIRDFHAANAMFGYGFFGTRPSSIRRVLKREGIAFEPAALGDMSKRGVYVVSFWNRGKPFHGLHTVAVLQKGGECIAFNNAGGRESHFEPSAYKDRVIKVYYLGKERKDPTLHIAAV